MTKSINTLVDSELRMMAIENAKRKLELYSDKNIPIKDRVVHLHGATRALFCILPPLHYFKDAEESRLLYIRIITNPANPFIKEERNAYISIFEHN